MLLLSGQFGTPSFSVNAFVGFVVATIISVLDSVADYYACASMCKEPAPPSHAINRGIAVEGFCTTVAGIVGCGHGTSTIGANLGAVGLTKVASRSVFVGVAILYMLFGVLNKLAAIFITVPMPVLGGVLIVMFGSFNGVILSNLKFIDISSSRNVTIIGTSLLFGLMIPQWIENYPGAVDTGNKDANNVIGLLLGNPNLAGTILACLLDNTVPGTKEERGIVAWQPKKTKTEYLQDYSIYDPLLPRFITTARCLRRIPFLPNPVVKL
ncbi:hypothetical protein KUTeg_001724 [Tegillarca granosa]|uniref:Uncharacterized protein n=1 Tax=Tegillarca granosa TaxID=220873 RepID=A0ABQ9FS89_TEGGR|nr:hypothetical protein KUTeg_001724 [Tegillarca granosa]